MSHDRETVLVTAGLPYANGPIHLGHLVEYIMTDIYVRATNMSGKEGLFIWAADTHGTPIELNARKAGVTPEAFVEKYAQEHVEDFEAFGIKFDVFHSTHSEENRKWVNLFFEGLKKNDAIERRSLEQLYDTEASQFLPDRFVKGTCPFCGATDQYGDVCENCHKTYEPTDLIDPKSVLTGSTPILKSSEHIFVRLDKYQSLLEEWVANPNHLISSTRNFVRGWIEGGLRDWCISRDKPYFGFEIPGEEDKFFYVWVDAPIGYVSATDYWAKQRGTPERVDEIWREGKARIVHVIGKDIVYFHTLFWPAMLHAAGLKTPDRVQAHGFLTVEGQKMSKTRGTFVTARAFREKIDPIYLRWFYASRLGPTTDDLDLSAEDLANIANAELVNNLANLVSRGVKFLNAKLDGQYASKSGAEAYRADIVQIVETTKQAYEAFDLANAVAQAVQLGTKANQLFQEGAPWKRVKDDPEGARDLITICLNLARAAVVLVAPVVPTFAQAAYEMLGLQGEPTSFDEALAFDLTSRPVGKGDVLASRISKSDLLSVIEASKPPPCHPAGVPLEPEIKIDAFSKVDLRVGLVKTAAKVEGSTKLLQLSVDLGEDKPRTIFSGIAQAYPDPSTLVGLRVVVVANLAPRKMKFGVSEGMVIAGGEDDLSVVIVPGELPPGSKVS